jgi:ATPase subunit of ABC transporter with duplicated ATPase domains
MEIQTDNKMANQLYIRESSVVTSTKTADGRVIPPQTPRSDVLVAKALGAIQNKATMQARANMTLPVSYEQFYTLIKAQAERIMSEQGKEQEYVIDEKIDTVLQRVYGYTQIGSRKGIALVGKYGCGKTLLMRSYIKAHNTLVEVGDMYRGIYHETSSSRLFNDLQDYERFKELCRVPMLIDELGRENVDGKHYGTEITPVIDLLFERWNYGAVTHITSNKMLETLSDDDHYGAMVGSRMADMFVFIKMDGDDRRNPKSLRK